MAEVTNTILLPGSETPVEGARVEARLVASTTDPNAGGFDPANDYEVLGITRTTTDEDGLWTLELQANSELEPDNTYYKITEWVGGRGTTHFVRVPALAGPHQLFAVLIEEPEDLPAGNGIPLTYFSHDGLGDGSPIEIPSGIWTKLPLRLRILAGEERDDLGAFDPLNNEFLTLPGSGVYTLTLSGQIWGVPAEGEHCLLRVDTPDIWLPANFLEMYPADNYFGRSWTFIFDALDYGDPTYPISIWGFHDNGEPQARFNLVDCYLFKEDL